MLIAGGALFLSATASASTRGFIVTDFDSVRLEAPIDVAVETGKGVAARGEGSADALDRLDLSVTARVLTIRLKRSPFERERATGGDTAKLFLRTGALRRVQLTGAGTIGVRGMDRARAEIVVAGSGSVAVAGLATDHVAVAQLGNGSIKLAGTAQSLTVSSSGTGIVDAEALEARDLDLTLDGSATIDVTASRAAKLAVIGPGSVRVHGQPACTVRHAGSGTVTCGGADY